MAQVRQIGLFVSSLTICSMAIAPCSESSVELDFLLKKYKLSDVDGTMTGPTSPSYGSAGDVLGYGVKLSGEFPLPDLGPLHQVSLALAGYYIGGDGYETTKENSPLWFIPVDGSGNANGENAPQRDLRSETSVTEVGLQALMYAKEISAITPTFALGYGLSYRSLSQERTQYGENISASSKGYLYLNDDLDTTTIGLVIDGLFRVKGPKAIAFCAHARLEPGISQHSFSSDQAINGTKYSASGDETVFSIGGLFEIGLDYTVRKLSMIALIGIETIDTADVDHANTDADVHPSRIESYQAFNYYMSVGWQVVF